MSVPPDLSLIVPCYQEAGHLRASVDAVREVLDATRLAYEIVFVDDGSTDGTREIVLDVCRADPRCRHIFHERNRGRGAAFKTGFTASTGRVTGFLDIDLEVHAHYLPALVREIEHGADVATGFRYYVLSQTGGLHRHLLSKAYRATLKLLVNCGVRDTETGCKFFRRETAAEVVLGSESDGWFWDTEVMARAALGNLVICELPVLFLRRADKRSTVRIVPDVLAYLRALRVFRPKVGLGLLDRSPIYWTCSGYDLFMTVLEGAAYRGRLAAVAQRIPDGASVVDVACGTARLYRDHLRARGCSYLGLDANGHFVMGIRKRGVAAKLFDARTDALPRADYLVTCASFYHFHSDADATLQRFRAAARRGVVISEPVRNLSQAPVVGPALAGLTNPGTGSFRERFDAQSFREFAQRNGATEFAWQPGERNAIAVFPPR